MVALDDIGIRFEDVSEFQLFVMLSRSLKQEETSILLGDVDLSAYRLQINPADGAERLYNAKTGSVIDRAIYVQITNFIRTTHNMKKNMDRGGNENARQYLLDRKRQEMQFRKRRRFKSVLFPLISSLCNCEQFKGDINSIWDMKVFAFYDSIKRVQKIMEARAVTAGIYAGTVDSKKIDKEILNWMGNV